jgi:hypothetical protein
MAKKGGRRGGNSAARSAAAKKGWETRRRGGAKAKPAATKRTTASKPAAKRGGVPKTTSARGRALTNQRRAADLVRAGRGGKGPSAKAVRSVLTAQRARAFYAATGGGKKRSAVKMPTAKAAAARTAAVRARIGGKGASPARKGPGKSMPTTTGSKSRIVLDEARWRRVVARAGSRRIARAGREADIPGGPFTASSEKRGLAAAAVQYRAERFLLGLTRKKGSQNQPASGLVELNSNFASRKRGSTGSTAIGVRARNAQYDAERKAKREANRQKRAAAAAAAAAVTPVKPRMAPLRVKTIRMPAIAGTLSGSRARLAGPGGVALRGVLRDIPTVARGRQAVSRSPGSRVYDTSLTQGKRIGGRERDALEKELVRQGFQRATVRGLGNSYSYSRQFSTSNKNPRGQTEIVTVQFNKPGKGPLAGASVSTRREVFVDSRQRNIGGHLAERAFGLPPKARTSRKPRRRRKAT